METSLAYASTPLALASLMIIVGVGLLKLVVAGKNNALSRLVAHYGFAAVIVFGLLGNASYLYSMYQTSEVIILGSVVDKNSNRYLPNVAIDTGGRARGMTSDTGDFVLAIPASRKSDSYEVSAVLPGYEKQVLTVKGESRMFVRFELQEKELKMSEVIKLPDHELAVGHFMGLPVIYLTYQIENIGNTQLTINNFSLSLSSPSGKIRQLIHANSSVALNAPIGPLLPQVQVKPGDRFTWVNGFVQYDNEIQQLANASVQALQTNAEFRQNGPRVNRPILPAKMTQSIQQIMLRNWFWETGATTIRVGFSANGNQQEFVRRVLLTEEQVDAMQRVKDYYSAGYGIIFGTELTPVGTALPGLRVAFEQ